MKPFFGLMTLALRDLVRRKMLWLFVILAIALASANYASTRALEQMLGNGQTWETATRRAASELESLAATIRTWFPVLVVLIAGQLAPETRRNGTAQFVLSTGVSRNAFAAAQLAALALFLAIATAILHLGFGIASYRVNGMTASEIALTWPLFFVPLLALAACVFALSLTASTIETYLVFLGVPVVTRLVPGYMGGFPKWTPRAVVRAVENLASFFPDISHVTRWPHLDYRDSELLIRAEWKSHAAQLVLVTLFWILLGLWRQRRHDFGSRTALK